MQIRKKAVAITHSQYFQLVNYLTAHRSEIEAARPTLDQLVEQVKNELHLDISIHAVQTAKHDAGLKYRKTSIKTVRVVTVKELEKRVKNLENLFETLCELGWKENHNET